LCYPQEKNMKSQLLLTLMVIGVLLASCSPQAAPAQATSTGILTTSTSGEVALATNTSQPTDTSLPPTETIVPATETTQPPTDTPTNTLAPTLSTATATAKSEAVNCRYGPGLNYMSIGALEAGESAVIVGKTEDGQYWEINNPKASGEKCWVANSVIVTSGDTGSVPVAAAPKTSVTDVSMSNPDTTYADTCSVDIDPIDLIGTIEVNGPLTVTWYFETEQGGKLKTHTTSFTSSGSFQVEDDSYTPDLDEGTYWVKLVVTDPVKWVAKASYSIECE
jgi:uncharacterized protein YraI